MAKGVARRIDGVLVVDRWYYIWKAMIDRCYNKNNKSYCTYGAKGVTVCEEWLNGYKFKEWYDENYIEGYEIDKDLSGLNEYSPAGCRFVSKKENILESISRRDWGYLSKRNGENHPYAKDIKHYETFAVTRGAFVVSCKKKGWNLDDFNEVYSGNKRKNYQKLYFYIKKES